MTCSAAQAERPACQRLAATELATVLDSHPELPCIAWTASPASPVVAGQGRAAWPRPGRSARYPAPGGARRDSGNAASCAAAGTWPGCMRLTAAAR